MNQLTRGGHRLAALLGGAAVAITSCGYQGLNSLPLPGAAGRGPGAQIYHIEIANAGALEPNSPVMIDDVVVGSVGAMRFHNWQANIDISVQPDAVVPANAIATIGQTSLLGSMHVALGPPPGQAPAGRLPAGATIASGNSTYPSTEQTLSTLSVVINGGGLGQIGDIIHTLSTAFGDRGPQIRDLLARLDTFMGTLDAQRANIIASIEALDRLAGTVAAQHETITRALHAIPPALAVLDRERPRIITALRTLETFSDTATRVVNDVQTDLVTNLTNLEPTLRALADVGPGLDTALAFATVFPFGQDAIDRQVRGDYINLSVIMDLTVPRLKRGLFLGTRWGQPGAPLVPAPGEPYHQQYSYSYNPLADPTTVAPAPADGAGPPATTPPIAAVLPVTPQTTAGQATAPDPSDAHRIFAGPYGPAPASDSATPQPGGG